MKIVMMILGVILTLVGVVWILQGFNILLGSMMSGHILYAILGVVLAVIGIALFVYGNRRASVTRSDDQSKMDR